MAKAKITGNSWYSDDQIREILTTELTDTVHYAPATVANSAELVDESVRGAIASTIEDGKPAVIPIHLGGNHWSGMVIKKKPDETLQVIYNDPTGAPLSFQKEIVEAITSMGGEATDIYDLTKKQQINGNDCGPFTVNNLVALARTDTSHLDFEGMRSLIRDEGKAHDLRIAHIIAIGQAEGIEFNDDMSSVYDRSIRISAGPDLYLDSSDDSGPERDFREEEGVIDRKSYVQYLMRRIVTAEGPTVDPDLFTARLGLVLHNYADRVHNVGEMRETYKRMKKDKLSIGEDDYFAASAKIEEFIDSQSHSIIEGVNRLKAISDPIEKAESYVRIYNHIFNSDVHLPEGIVIQSSSGSGADSREELKKRLRDFHSSAGAINLEVKDSRNLTHYISPSSDESANEVGKLLLSYSQIVGRRDRREAKAASASGSRARRDSWVSTDSEGSEISTRLLHFVYESGKVRTLMPSLGTYSKSVKALFGTTPEDVRAMAREVKSLVATGEASDSKALKLVHLMFITEEQRTRATSFTAPMFLDEIERTGEVNVSRFPMSAKGTVDGMRDIHSRYQEALPATRRFDEGEKTRTAIGDHLLKKEGILFAEWLESKEETGLQTSIQSLDCSFKLNDILNKPHVSEPPKDYASLREKLSILTSSKDMPEEFNEFKRWVTDNRVIEGLREKALEKLDEKIERGLAVLDSELLGKWYQIDTSKVLSPRHEKYAESDRTASTSIDKATTTRTFHEMEAAQGLLMLDGTRSEKVVANMIERFKQKTTKHTNTYSGLLSAARERSSSRGSSSSRS